MHQAINQALLKQSRTWGMAPWGPRSVSLSHVTWMLGFPSTHAGLPQPWQTVHKSQDIPKLICIPSNTASPSVSRPSVLWLKFFPLIAQYHCLYNLEVCPFHLVAVSVKTLVSHFNCMPKLKYCYKIASYMNKSFQVMLINTNISIQLICLHSVTLLQVFHTNNFICIQLNYSTYCYVSLTIQLDISHCLHLVKWENSSTANNSIQHKSFICTQFKCQTYR